MEILIASASGDLCKEIRNTLKEHSVLFAYCRDEAEHQIKKNNIDLVILDLDIDKSSLNFINTIKSDKEHQHIIIIMLTDINRMEDEIKGFQLGANDYFRKPVRADSFKAIIDVYAELLEQRKNKQKSIEQAVILDAIFQQSPVGIAISHGVDSLEGTGAKPFQSNEAYKILTGRSHEELVKLGWAAITHPDDIEKEIVLYRDMQQGKTDYYSMEKRYVRPDGSIVWAYVMALPLKLPNRHGPNHICMALDITSRKTIEIALSESERSKSVIFSHLPGMVYRCHYDRKWTMEYISDGCKELIGYAAESLLFNRDLSFNDVIAPEYRDFLWNEWKRTLSKKMPFKQEYEIITSQQKRKWVLEMGEGIFTEDGKVEALEGFIFDISDRKKIEDELRYNNEHDIWTGLFNRRYLDKFLHEENKAATGTKSALISISLNELYTLGMTHGYDYHQGILKSIAELLSSFGSESCSLFHISENRFLFHLKGYGKKQVLIDFCETVADALISLLGVENIGGGIGIVEIDRINRKDIDNLIKNALIASEKASHVHDRDFGFYFFDSSVETGLMREEQIRQELTQIVSGENPQRLFLQYQPIIDLKTDQVWAFEALARLNSELLGPVPPSEFIPIAEKTKLIIPLGDIIIRQALSFSNKVKNNYHKDIYTSINISAIQLLRNDFYKTLFKIIEEMQADPESIYLEITESVFASNYQELNKMLGKLKEMGIKSAIDDFGTGYSSLARERELNVNSLKIDRYFINKLTSLQSLDEALTEDIISMAHKLGHSVIAEGVEQEKQREYLIAKKCDRIQGYLISRPLGEEAAIRFVKNYHLKEV